MTRPGWFAAVLLPALAVVAAAWPLDARTPRVEGTPTAPSGGETAAPPDVGRAVGAAGCASAGCHGAPSANTGATAWSSSAIQWMAADPHRKAYAVLDGDPAKKMMAALSASGCYAKTATEEARCLACHTNPALASDDKSKPLHLRTEGVSCEACHGNASGWLNAHTGFASARDHGARIADQYAGGMAKLYDLGERAAACAGCHVGAPAGNGLPLRDMNHDMIAAGHPRLNFDFATYQAMLPRHWFERDRTQPGDVPAGKDFEARSWLVGRVAHAEAACKLTADRATRVETWPEFAESSCVACHHRLSNPFEKDASAQKYPAAVGRPLGSPPWQPIWPVTRPADFAALNPGPAAGAVSALQSAMQHPRPTGKAKEAATKAADDLKTFRTQVAGLSGTQAVAALEDVLAKASAIPPAEWDRDLTEQVFLGRAALERVRIAHGEKADRAAFAAAYDLLKQPRGTIDFSVKQEAAAAVRGLVKE